MNRYKWYHLGLPISFKELVKGLMLKKYVMPRPSGFLILDIHEKSFRFVWEANLVKTSLDMDGVPATELISTVNFCDFTLLEKKDKFWLRIIDPPRSVKDLMNALEDVCGFGFFVEPITFKQNSLPPSLLKIDGSSIIGLKAVGSIPGQHAVARIEIASKEGLNIENLEFLKNFNYTIDNLVYEIVFKRTRGQVAFSSNGLLKISGQLAPLILNLIEIDLVVEAA